MTQSPTRGRVVRWFACLILTAGVLGAGWTWRAQWWPVAAGWAQQWSTATQTAAAAEESTHAAAAADEARILKLSPQARRNLGLVSRPARLQNYWRKVLIPGEIIDRPGVSDRGVTAPAVGVVTQVHAYPGDTVQTGQPLFTLRLFSEYLQNSQSELFKASQEARLVEEQIARLTDVVRTGALPEARLVELKQQLQRQQSLILAHRQDLVARGLVPEQIEKVTQGEFVSSITILAPPALQSAAETSSAPDVLQVAGVEGDELVYEVQELAVDLGQQVQAGQLLAKLANHRLLYVVGHAFKSEAPWLEQAAQNEYPLEIEFAEEDAAQWPTITEPFVIRHLANSIDPVSRTFNFFVPLTNQARGYSRAGETFLVWRFRPGQRTRLHVPVEELRDVFVIPAEAVVRDGPEAYVFRQNGDLFDRREVHLLHEDRLVAVIANDGSIHPGMYLAQSAGASLNRVLKAQAASGEQPGMHVHADGSVHAH